MIKPGQIIKHKLFMDVSFLVLRASHKLTALEVTGEWINLGYEKSFNIGESQTIVIPIDKLPEWQICQDPDLDCLRLAKWTPVSN